MLTAVSGSFAMTCPTRVWLPTVASSLIVKPYDDEVKTGALLRCTLIVTVALVELVLEGSPKSYASTNNCKRICFYYTIIFVGYAHGGLILWLIAVILFCVSLSLDHRGFKFLEVCPYHTPKMKAPWKIIIV